MQPQEQPKESLVDRVIQAALKDGTLAAAWRQGVGEIGEALKAFPDSIQVRELGTINTPTPGEIGQQRGLFGIDHEQESSASLVDQALDAGRENPGQDHDRPTGRGR